MSLSLGESSFSYPISRQSREDRPEKGTTGAEGSDQLFLVAGESPIVQVVFDIDQNGRDDSRVIAKEQARQRRIQSDEIDKPADREFVYAIGMGRSRDVGNLDVFTFGLVL